MGNGRKSRIGPTCVCERVHTQTYTQNTHSIQTQTYRHTQTRAQIQTDKHTYSNMCKHSHLVCGSVTESPEPAQPPQDTRLLGMTLSAKMAPYFPPAISEAARGPWVGPGQDRAGGG